jgi:hypothetical protein
VSVIEPDELDAGLEVGVHADGEARRSLPRSGAGGFRAQDSVR